jgi:hypothetical protein
MIVSSVSTVLKNLVNISSFSAPLQASVGKTSKLRPQWTHHFLKLPLRSKIRCSPSSSWPRWCWCAGPYGLLETSWSLKGFNPQSLQSKFVLRKRCAYCCIELKTVSTRTCFHGCSPCFSVWFQLPFLCFFFCSLIRPWWLPLFLYLLF